MINLKIMNVIARAQNIASTILDGTGQGVYSLVYHPNYIYCIGGKKIQGLKRLKFEKNRYPSTLLMVNIL